VLALVVADPWNPTQYEKFLQEREQPFFDLLALIHPASDMRVVDLGCGTGRLTRELHERLAARETIGIDRSTRMLDAGGTEPLPGLRFDVADIESFPSDGARYDLIFSNAALHWVEHHDTLFERLVASLERRGQLAVQMPAMHDEAAHVVARELIAEEPFRSACGGWQKPQPVLAPDAYGRLLVSLGITTPVVRLIVYRHVLAAPEDVVEWVKGTLLGEYSRHLSAELFEHFLSAYRERLLARLDASRPYVFPFKRILIWGQRADA
jgi:trans-aconitate 2-methyltransferase